MSRKGPRYLFSGRESSGQRMVGRHSDKISQSLEESEKQLRRADEKRARRGAVRLEAASRGQIEGPPLAEEQALRMAIDAEEYASIIYADEELRCDPEAEVNHLRPDQ